MDLSHGGQAIATVAGREITAERLMARVDQIRRGPRGRHLPPDAALAPDQLRWIVQELVIEAVLAHEAREAGHARPTDEPPSAADIRRLVERVTAGVRVDEADVRGYYDRNRDLFASGTVPYEEVRESIEAELLVDARRRAFDAWLDGRRRALAVVAPGFEHPGHPIHGVPSHRH